MSDANLVDPIADAKRALRKSTIASRDALPADVRAASSRAICARVNQSPEFERARCVLLFASFGTEVDTSDLLGAALDRGKRLVLPRVNPDTKALELREVASLPDDLRAGLWDIPEPDPSRCPIVEITEIDFVLIPGVAFNQERDRMGYGGGYYDRLQTTLGPGTGRIAVAFSMQILPDVPSAAHDVRVPVIITESERID